jgi:hypothetical protein
LLAIVGSSFPIRTLAFIPFTVNLWRAAVYSAIALKLIPYRNQRVSPLPFARIK